MMESWFLLPAAALLVGACALVPLGQQVLRRGVVFMDLAVAQAAAAGSLWALVVLHRADDGAQPLLDLSGLAGSLVCALAVAWLSRRWPPRREALIGLLYVLFACLALLGARMDPHGRDRLLELLAADVLWVQGPQILALSAAAALLWAGLLWKPSLMEHDALFYTGFALIISLAVPVLGLFVVFALLIGPALWDHARHEAAPPGPREPHDARPENPEHAEHAEHPHSTAWRALSMPLALAGSACLMGLAASWWWDAPSGACVALSCAVLGLGAVARRR